MLRMQRKVGHGKYFEPADAAAEMNLQYEPGQVQLSVDDFNDMGWINEAFTLGGGPDGGLSCSLTSRGVEEAEDIEHLYPIDTDEAPLTDESGAPFALEVSELAGDQDGLKIDESNPTAGTHPTSSEGKHYINISNESLAFGEEPKVVPGANRFLSRKDNQQPIEALTSAVEDLIEAVRADRTNDFDDKEGYLGELLVLELALAQPQVSVPLIEGVIKGAVKTLTTLFAGAVIGSLASNVIALAKPLIGSLF